MSTDVKSPKKEDITHGTPNPNRNEPNTNDPKNTEIKEPNNNPSQRTGPQH
jgi:hypothetical protein